MTCSPERWAEIQAGLAKPPPVCDVCDTPFHVAVGPHGSVVVPSCWCAADRRKAEGEKA